MVFRPTFISPRLRNKCQGGFSLVEIMVGVAVGLIGVLIMTQMGVAFDSQKRSTTGSGDAQSTGMIAFSELQRELRQAGYGIDNTKILGCNLEIRSGVWLNNISAVTINHPSIPAGDANTDTVLVVYGAGNGSPDGDGITSQPAATQYAVQTPSSYVANDRVVATLQTRPATCNLSLDTVTGVATPNVSVTTGVASMTNGTLFNLGQTPRVKIFAVRSGSLTACDYMTADCTQPANAVSQSVWAQTWVPIGGNVVSLRAQYLDGLTNTYGTTTPSTACGWVRTPAVRLALVSRNARQASGTVTSAAPAWAGSTASPIVLSGNSGWQGYRYKVFETTMPLKNTISMGVPPGC